MKTFKLISTALFVVLMSVTSCKYDDTELWDNVNQLEDFYTQLEDRVAQLETLCKKNNENINSLQTIVEVLQDGDYITDFTPITNDNVEIGYKITFAKKGTITIYHGKDGKDGENGKDGADGKDGHNPIVGVKKGTDGIYYWTLDGEFVVVDGQKMYVQGKDGENGHNGVTPQFKIENGYWYVSYNYGISWNSVGKATENANYNFKNIAYDNDNVYLTLADGTIITISKANLVLPNGETFNSIVNDFLSKNKNLTKIKFVANSQITSDTKFDGTNIYLVANGEWLEIHTSGKEILANEDCFSMFDGQDVTGSSNNFSRLKEIVFSDYFNTKNVTNMRRMFRDCSALTSLDLSNFNTVKVTNMRYMFRGCSSLTSLDLSSFNIENVITMENMFYECSSLTSLDLSSFNTVNLINMNGMFSGCSSLTSLDLSSFNTSSVEDMGNVFVRCSSLTSLDLSSFNTSSVNNMGGMFSECSSLTSLDLSSFNTSNVDIMTGMFGDCYSLTSLDLSSFNTSSVWTMQLMFRGCSSLTSLDLSSFNTVNLRAMDGMFDECSSLTSLNLSSFNTSSVEEMSYAFNGCSLLTSLDLSTFSFTNNYNIYMMLKNVGQNVDTKPIVIKVTEDGYTYLKNGNTGINSNYAKFVKPTGEDW